MSDSKDEEIGNVITFFNRQVTQIFKFIDSCDEYQGNVMLDKVRILIKVVKAVNPSEMLERCNKDAIIDRDAAFFQSSDVMNSYVKDDENKEWLTELIEFVKDQYDNFDDDEMGKIWDYINNMLEAVIKYRMLTGV
jgi:hypothetical protein